MFFLKFLNTIRVIIFLLLNFLATRFLVSSEFHVNFIKSLKIFLKKTVNSVASVKSGGESTLHLVLLIERDLKIQG